MIKMQLYKNNSWKELKFNTKSKKIPETWEKISIGNIIKPNDKSKLKASEGLKEGEYPFFNCSETQTKFCNTFLVEGENIFITTGGDYMFNLYFNGKAAYSTDVWAVKIENNNAKFIDYFLKYNFTANQDYFRGFKFKHLDKKGFKNMDIPLPPLEEQEKIAYLLSCQESIINKTKELINNTEKRNRFMMDEFLSGRLRIKEENGETFFYKNPDDNWNEFNINGEKASIPKDWNKKEIEKSFIEKPKSKITAKTGKKEGLYPFFNCSEKQTLRTDSYLVDEEVLFFSTGGKPSVLYSTGKAAYSTDVWAVSFKNEFTNKFIYYYLKKDTNVLERCFKGSGLKHLNKKDFAITEIIQPNLAEQGLIVNVLDNLNLEVETYKKILEKEEKTFTFLLEELMSGRLRIKI